MASGPRTRFAPALAVTPSAALTALFCVKLLAALIAMEPLLDVMGPLRLRSPALVRLVAVKTMSPRADTPPDPIVSGLLAIMVIRPLGAVIAALFDVMPPVLFSAILPLAALMP